MAADKDKVRVAVVGAGYWGINHVRTFATLPTAELVAVCDASERARARASALAPKARPYERLEQVLESNDVDAVVLATPAKEHARQAVAAIDSGKHVLVEKPLGLSVADALLVVEAAERSRTVCMVGHLMLYHPGVEALRQLIAQGELGTLLYVYALRVNLGKLRSDENALWSLAPHDLSMLEYLLDAEPATVAARGECYLQQKIEDVVFVNLHYPSKVMAQIQLSWLDPRKERRLTLVGSRKMVEFDDVHPSEKLKIYDKGYDRPPEFTHYGEYLSIRTGEIRIPPLKMVEPLVAECSHFVECIRSTRTPRSDVRTGLRVVRALAAAQRSLETGGTPVRPADL